MGSRMTEPVPVDEEQPAWRQRAVTRGIEGARTRAAARVQRFLDAAFELIDEKGTTDFTIQEVINRSGQSLRGFYQYFDGKDQLLLALFEESVNESLVDLRAVAEAETAPLARLRAFVLRLHEWCDPDEGPAATGPHNRRPISEFTVQLAGNHADKVQAAVAPLTADLVTLLDAARDAGAVDFTDARRAAALVMRAVMYSWFGNRFTPAGTERISAEETWEFCLHGLRAGGGERS
jgi:AcrR family transcriptional regulator